MLIPFHMLCASPAEQQVLSNKQLPQMLAQDCFGDLTMKAELQLILYQTC